MLISVIIYEHTPITVLWSHEDLSVFSFFYRSRIRKELKEICEKIRDTTSPNQRKRVVCESVPYVACSYRENRETKEKTVVIVCHEKYSDYASFLLINKLF